MFSKLSRHSTHRPSTRGVVLLAACLLLSLGAPRCVFAGVESDPNLAKLEVKFFEHDYAKEDVATRLERLEKLVFGEAKSGDTAVRLKNLVAAVPNLDASAADQSPPTTAAAEDQQQPAAPSAKQPPPSRGLGDDVASREQQIENGSQYPQVSAMEKRILGHDYSNEPLAKRLERLETKEFGKPVQSDDLSERVDRLKARTGIDLAKTPPPGSDWSDDDEPAGGGSMTYVPADTTPFAGSHEPPASSDYGGSSRGIGSLGGGYGMGAGSAPSAPLATGPHGGGYGYNPPHGSAPRVASANTPRVAPPSLDPQPAPDVVREPPVAPPAAVGLNQRVVMLENDLFNKTFANDTLPARVARLESTVFPGKRTPADMSLPERVARLVDVVGPGASDPVPIQASKRVAQRGPDPSASADPDQDPQMPRPAPQRSGLSRIMNGLGNLLGGGSGYGSYPVGSNLVTDPQTGMLVDMYSGNIIDPRTGAVIGNRGAGIPATGYGGTPYSGFNNGLSPLGSPYGGMGMSRMGFGIGGGRMGMGSGMGFGMGSGMGLGTGLGGMGMGIWP